MLYDVIYRGRILRIAIGIMVLFSVMAGGAGAAKIIKDNSTGGDCSLFGTWTAGTKTCTMTIDLNETIQIDSNSLTLDGNGHTLTGGADAIYLLNGIYLSGRNGILVKNLNIRKFQVGISLINSNNNYFTGINALNNDYGIDLRFSNNNTLSGINVISKSDGIWLSGSNNNTLIGNNVSKNTYGIYLYQSSNNTIVGNNASNNINGGILLGSSSNNNILSGNNANFNNPASGIYKGEGIYMIGSNSNTLSDNNFMSNGDGIDMIDSSSNTLCNNNVSNNTGDGIKLESESDYNVLKDNIVNSNNGYGIYLFVSKSNNIKSNNVSNNIYGIHMSGSKNNIINGNIANSNNNYGILLVDSGSNILSGNTANSNNNYGIYLSSTSSSIYWSSNYNILSENNASSNKDYGFYILSSNSNTLSGNNASNNYYGVYISSSINNTIFNNLFINNNNFESSTSSNIWNTTKTPGPNIIGGPYLGGNVWANPDGTGFSQTCPDLNDDRICDPSYTLDASNIDYLPISMDFTKDMIPPKRVSKLKNVSYASAFINWTWTDPSDPDFELVEIYINNIYKTSVQKGVQYYKAKKLYANRSYKISTRTKDQSGNINPIWKNKTALTKPDLAPPMNVTNLNNITYSNNYINWTWKNPKDDDFTKVIVFIDNEFKGNVSKGKKYYNATNFTANTEHIISTWTMDRNGNINKTWTNSSAWTAK